MHWFVNRPHDNGCVYYRHTLPIRHLMPELAQLGVRVTHSQRLDLDREYDAYFFARAVDAVYVPVILELKRRGKIIVWDLDDDLMALERYDEKDRDEAKLVLRSVNLCLDMADVITVSTEHLKARVDRPDKTVVVPNLIDLGDNPIEPYVYRDPVILFTGSPSHAKDVELVRALHHQTQRDYRWVWYGLRPEWLSGRDTWIPWSRVKDYPRTCRFVRPRICLAPLTVERFNLSKSPIKIWECATLGASVIASDFGPYAGSAAAIVPALHEFSRDHLDQVEDQSNRWDCLAEARRNSWQHGDEGRARWSAMYQHVMDLCEEQAAVAA